MCFPLMDDLSNDPQMSMTELFTSNEGRLGLEFARSSPPLRKKKENGGVSVDMIVHMYR